MLYRKARLTDAEEIHSLINHYAEEGLMLGRSRNMIYEFIRDFTVAEDNGQIIAVGALHILWEDLAEVRALAVNPDYTKKGVGRELIKYFIEEAQQLGIPKVFSLTYQLGFFEKCGFTSISKDNLPPKVWKECIDCPKFPNCDENAVIVEV